jgi:hypothetical protein
MPSYFLRAVFSRMLDKSPAGKVGQKEDPQAHGPGSPRFAWLIERKSTGNFNRASSLGSYEDNQ